MGRRLALATFIAALGPTLMACHPEGWSREEVDLGISTDLSVVSISGSSAYVAAGSSGVIVTWEQAPRRRKDRVVRVTDLGDRDLHAIGGFGETTLIVGDGGTAAISHDNGWTWTPVDLGVSADLHAIVWLRSGGTLVIGDDVVLHRPFEGDEWTELSPPEGGWGQLRAGVDWDRLYLVGLDGVAWTNDDILDPASLWVAEATGVTADLLAVDVAPEVDDAGVIVVGSDGLLLHKSYLGWRPIPTDLEVDSIRYANYRLLTADGELFDVEHVDGAFELSSFGTFAGALGFDAHGEQIVVVGADGFVVQLFHHEVPPW